MGAQSQRDWFVQRLRRLLAAAGHPHQAQLLACDTEQGLTRSSLSDLLAGKFVKAPPWERISAYVTACVNAAHARQCELSLDEERRRLREDHARLTELLDTVVLGETPAHPRATDRGRTEISGVIEGVTVQAGVIHGGVHIHHAVPENAWLSRLTTASILSMPRDIAAFTGRDEELGELLNAITATAASPGGESTGSGIYAVDGMPGIGKTAFAVHAAHLLRDCFPDGLIFLPLHGHTSGQRPVDPTAALGSLLAATGVDASTMPTALDDRAALWRHRMTGRKALVLLDNAASHEQVRPLFPSSQSCAVLITSRRRLEGIDDLNPITLGTLPLNQAATLFNRLSRNRDDDPDALAELMGLCGYLPLAISLLAGRLRHHPSWNLRYLATKVARTQDRLAELRAENLAVESTFRLSYDDLPLEQRQLFRRLGLHPGADIDAYAAAALDGRPVDTTAGRLDALYTDNLVDELHPGRYRCHDLIRDYARKLASHDPTVDNTLALDRLLDYYLHCTTTASSQLPDHRSINVLPPRSPGQLPDRIPGLDNARAAREWLDSEHANISASISRIARNQPVRSLYLADAVQPHLEFRGHWALAHAIQCAALEAIRHTSGKREEAVALTNLGRMQRRTGDHREAEQSLTEAFAIQIQLGDELGQANALANLGSARARLGNYSGAAQDLTRAQELYARLGELLGRASALKDLGEVQILIGDYANATETLTKAHAMNIAAGSRRGEANTLIGLGRIQYMNGHYEKAAETLNRAHALHVQAGSRLGQANTLVALGRVYYLSSDYQHAGDTFTTAHEIFTDLGHRHGQAATYKNIGRVHQATGDLLTAVTQLTLAHDLHVETGDRNGQAEVLNDLGLLEKDRSRLPEAIDKYRRAWELTLETGSLPQQAVALEGLGRCLVESGRTREGSDRLREALTLYRQLQAPQAAQVAAFLELLSR
ncbi:ATP-binding protein [Amycolatopsis sp. H20-H5]|uniref:ATP-binding protein n=1 Tax=Amycolatopsis sp. H20-H5 TaxID=3046309 RepID=UPI002DB6420B|nr:tetratricopeptide repeat protein [Amycolatopsis sp. H20-H5]MEC3979886.1 tetratricopeptide repeat protein [Amycolatopsis sp. H20-H5]